MIYSDHESLTYFANNQKLKDGVNPRANKMIKDLHQNLKALRKVNFQKRQDQAEKKANKKRIEGPILKEGDKAYLDRKKLKTKRPSDKRDFM
jgi:hypothetical protein